MAEALTGAGVAGASVISRLEMAAALTKAIRLGTLTRQAAASALQVFRSEWPTLVRVQAMEILVARADELAWQLGLRGFDALHLASALTWQEGMGEEVTVATFERQLWQAAGQRRLTAFPPQSTSHARCVATGDAIGTQPGPVTRIVPIH